jgi:hypothetical protein
VARPGDLLLVSLLVGGGAAGLLLIVLVSLVKPAPGLIAPALLTSAALPVVSVLAIGAPETEAAPAPPPLLPPVLAGMFGSEPLESAMSPPFFEQPATSRLDAAKAAPVARSAVRQVVEIILAFLQEVPWRRTRASPAGELTLHPQVPKM